MNARNVQRVTAASGRGAVNLAPRRDRIRHAKVRRTNAPVKLVQVAADAAEKNERGSFNVSGVELMRFRQRVPIVALCPAATQAPESVQTLAA
ncbi:MAG: hypothetical protein QY326_05110 [Bdellovibrionota bacterium]|nr:MAG: hypothetical protein QY326_05110 [Bdellovibrionota bacterium]